MHIASPTTTGADKYFFIPFIPSVRTFMFSSLPCLFAIILMHKTASIINAVAKASKTISCITVARAPADAASSPSPSSVPTACPSDAYIPVILSSCTTPIEYVFIAKCAITDDQSEPVASTIYANTIPIANAYSPDRKSTRLNSSHP